MKEKNVIEVENLSKVFGDFTAVNQISFEVGKGEIFGFLGVKGLENITEATIEDTFMELASTS